MASHGRFAPQALGMAVPVLTSPTADRDKYVGRLVAVRGVVSASKITRLAGVEIAASDELRGREAYAVGILGKFVLTEAAIRAQEKRDGPSAHDGPGVKYRLYSDLAGTLAEAQPWPK